MEKARNILAAGAVMEEVEPAAANGERPEGRQAHG